MKKPYCHIAMFSCIVLSSCTKHTCPAYMDYPDCTTESRTRFYGFYRGISTLDNGGGTNTQWSFGQGPALGEINITEDFTIILDPGDPRSFTVRDHSFFGNGEYIPASSSKGFFNSSEHTVEMEFWLEDATGNPASRRHYKFTGTRL